MLARAGPPGLGIRAGRGGPGVADLRARKAEVSGEAVCEPISRCTADSATLTDLLTVVDRLNRSGVADGILVQSPLPGAMGADAERRVFDAIRPDKDVDGFHPVNVGRLVQNRASRRVRTPSGVIELLTRSQIRLPEPRGRHRPERHRRRSRWRCCCCIAMQR